MGKTERGANRVHYFALWSFVFSAVFCSTLLMPRWHTLRFFAVGISKLDIGIGLENLYLELDCTSYLRESLALDEQSIKDTQSDKVATLKHVLSTAVSPANKVCGYLQFLNGEHPLRYARELTCGVRQSVSGVSGIDFDLGCDLFSRAFIITKLLFVIVVFCATLEFIAGVCTLTYWYNRPIKIIRQIAFICMATASILALGGVLISGLMFSGQGTDITSVSTAIVKPINKFLSGTPIQFGSVLQQHKDITTAYATFIFAAAAMFSALLPIFYMSLFPIHKFESDDEECLHMEDQLAAEYERQKLLLYDPAQQSYNAGPVGEYAEDPAYSNDAYFSPPQPGYGSYEQA